MGRKLAYGALVIIALGLSWVLLQMLERYEEPVNHGWSQAALRNPYLAAEQFLQANDLPARSSDRANTLKTLSLDSIVLLGDTDLLANEELAQELEVWLQAGGHAIVAVPWHEPAGPETFLSRFGVYKFRDDGNSTGYQEQDIADIVAEVRQEILRMQETDAPHGLLLQDKNIGAYLRQLEAQARTEKLVGLHFTDDDYTLRIDFADNGALYHPELYEEEAGPGYSLSYWTGNDDGPLFMQLEVGNGLLTAMPSLDIWASEKIGLFDHAHLLRRLVGGADEVIFLNGARSLSLMSMIWTYYPELLLVTLLWLLAWIIYRSRRFGPVLSLQNGGRRSFVEHIQAVGHFMWRQKKSADLLAVVRADVWQAMQQRFPGSEAMSESDKLETLLQHTQLQRSELQHLMTSPAAEDEVQFFHTIKSLQEIRKAL